MSISARAERHCDGEIDMKTRLADCARHGDQVVLFLAGRNIMSASSGNGRWSARASGVSASTPTFLRFGPRRLRTVHRPFTSLA
jgi:hypothetical protein